MREPDVTLTNLVIVIECLAFGLACARRPRTMLRDTLIAFFAASALASGSAGVVHGYAPDPAEPGHVWFWTMTMLAIIGGSAMLCLAAGELGNNPVAGRKRRARFIMVAASCLAAVVLLGARSFTLAVAAYVPASVWLASILVVRWRDRGSWPLLVGAAGLVLAILAGVSQQLRYTPTPGLLSHNAWYHVLQIVAFAAFYIGCGDLLANLHGGFPHARSS